jgi:hypothetical protein
MTFTLSVEPENEHALKSQVVIHVKIIIVWCKYAPGAGAGVHSGGIRYWQLVDPVAVGSGFAASALQEPLIKMRFFQISAGH